MSRTFEKYLAYIEKNGDPFPIPKSKIKPFKFTITGPNGNHIYLKESIALSYGSSDEKDTVYIEDISDNKQFTNDLNTREFQLHLSDTILHIDFDTNYYYELYEFDTFEQFTYCVKNKKLNIALLNEDKTDIIKKCTSNVNLLW